VAGLAVGGGKLYYAHTWCIIGPLTTSPTKTTTTRTMDRRRTSALLLKKWKWSMFLFAERIYRQLLLNSANESWLTVSSTVISLCLSQGVCVCVCVCVQRRDGEHFYGESATRTSRPAWRSTICGQKCQCCCVKCSMTAATVGHQRRSHSSFLGQIEMK